MTATFYVGDAVTVMNTLPEKSVDLILTSPPFLALRSYLPQDHPDKALEGGSQSTPGEYVDWLLDVVEACARVLAPHGSLVFELGDTYAGSGGAGGDYNDGSLREGQPSFEGSAKFARHKGRNEWEAAHPINRVSGTRGGPGGKAWPLAKSLSLIPETFRWAMVYGHNPHTGRTTAPWRLRNVIRWVRPNPPVGALGDKFRPATSELMVFCKAKDRYFDLDAVRTPSDYDRPNLRGQGTGPKGHAHTDTPNMSDHTSNPAGAPPLDWWNIPGDHSGNLDWLAQLLTERDLNDPLDELPLVVQENYRRDASQILLRAIALFQDSETPPLDWWNIPPGGYPGAHYAVWPPELLVKPIKAMCPESVCRVCGEARRRIVGEATYPGSVKDGAQADGVFMRGGKSVAGLTVGSNAGLTRVAPTIGWTDCGHSCEKCGGTGKVKEWRLDSGLPRGGVSGYQGREWDIRCPDCSGVSAWRPGLVLDPFAGSGTTLSVATGHGRDAIGIDLDERNYELSLDRVGPLILTRADGTAPRP